MLAKEPTIKGTSRHFPYRRENMKPFILAMIISVVLIVLILIFEPAKFFYHNMDCTGGIGGGCDRSTARGIWSWLAK